MSGRWGFNLRRSYPLMACSIHTLLHGASWPSHPQTGAIGVNGARVLIVTWDGGGSAVPAYNLGRRLLRARHEPHLLGWVDQAGHAADAGLQFTAYPSVPSWPTGLSQDDGIEQIFDHLSSDRTRQEITATIEQVRPDVLVIDAMMAAAYAAAADSGLPTAVLCHLLGSLFSGPWGEMVMGRPTIELLAGTDRVLALTRRDFDAGGGHDCLTYVGPILRPDVDSSPAALAAAGLEGLTRSGDRWVLASLSTTLQNQPEMLPALLEQLGSLPARVLLTLGGAVAPSAVAPPANAVVRGFVPHELVLPHVGVFISHAGLSGISTSLAHGVPLVCLPQGRDQAHNAARVVDCGVGLDPGIDGLGDAVITLLDDPSYALRAAAFHDPDSGAEATRLVADLATRHP
jgi:UDP:flavonoid glycosyltransferase YjiC (YdhE family)